MQQGWETQKSAPRSRKEKVSTKNPQKFQDLLVDIVSNVRGGEQVDCVIAIFEGLGNRRVLIRLGFSGKSHCMT